MKIVSIATSKKKGTRKNPINNVKLIKDYGIDGDAHAGNWHRQISFLDAEKIQETKDMGLKINFGDFAENIVTIGVKWQELNIEDRLQLGESAIVEITQFGKVCHNKCAIYYQAGDCIMPKFGVFARVIKDGKISLNDEIIILKPLDK